MLEVKHISTGYGKKQVLFDVSLEVAQGEIVLLIGGNGSGKSTLLKTIYNLLPVWNDGEVFFNKERITGLKSSELLKRGLLYIPAQNNLFEQLSVKENLEMAGLRISDSKLLRERIEQALTFFPVLQQQWRRMPMKMSGGERKMLTLAMAMLHQPKMIMIDEPFTGLSVENILLVRDRIQRLNEEQGVTFFVVEHRVKESMEMADRWMGMRLGTIAYKNREATIDLVLFFNS
jgi:branched-chain amino acid transport system ATP-binding protein